MPPDISVTESVVIALWSSSVPTSVAGIVAINKLLTLLITVPVTIEISPAAAATVPTSLSHARGRKSYQYQQRQQREHYSFLHSRSFHKPSKKVLSVGSLRWEGAITSDPINLRARPHTAASK